MNSNSLVSISDISKEEILRLLENARYFEENPNHKILDGKVVATLFFEPSTRTRLSFETAVNRLGGRVIGFSDASTTSSSKGETLKDTIKMVSNYVDLIVMRHYLEGAARYATEVTDTPIINAGDGAHQHPSQTMLDLYSIYKTQGTLENLTITMVGDLKYGRTVHSLLMAMQYFNPTFNFVACDELKMPAEYKEFCDQKGIKYTEHKDFSEEVINSSDIIYMTRVQRERFTDIMEYEKVKNLYNLHNAMLDNSKDNLRILHPLPRVNEIDQDVDDNPKAYYFQQAQNGLYARQAIICRALNIDIKEVQKS
ncbi:MAG: aspartate carbamoyltransferase [Bacteroidales bacterium]|nr:aspartate carbamoyltransferase [Bacteroidales bacterium]